MRGMRPDVFSFPARNGRQECKDRMPKLPGEPRLQFSQGFRAYIGGAIRQKNFLEAGSDRMDGCPCHSSVDSGAAQVRLPVPKRLVARLPLWRPGHPIRLRTNMSDEKVDLLCDDCGQAFSDFLNEMAERNAKVATCPKCGKIHEFPSKTAKDGTRSVKKVS